VSAGCHSVGEKKPSEMVKNWVLHHDNVPCQTALAVQQYLVKNRTAVILQQPYPPDLTPCNFCHFSRPKTRLKGHHFTSAEEIQQNIAACLTATSIDDFQRHFQQWQVCWRSCMCRSEAFPGWLSHILYTSISVWIMTAFQELSDLPTLRSPAVPISNGTLNNLSAWKHRRCTVLQ